MSALLICIVLALSGQNPGTVVIKEAELAPPPGMSMSGAPVTTAPALPNVKEELNAVEAEARQRYDEGAQELQWEYDEHGNPVASSVNQMTPEPALPTPAPVPAPTPVQTPAPMPTQNQTPAPVTEVSPSPSTSYGTQPVMTFWFVVHK